MLTLRENPQSGDIKDAIARRPKEENKQAGIIAERAAKAVGVHMTPLEDTEGVICSAIHAHMIITTQTLIIVDPALAHHPKSIVVLILSLNLHKVQDLTVDLKHAHHLRDAYAEGVAAVTDAAPSLRIVIPSYLKQIKKTMLKAVHYQL